MKQDQTNTTENKLTSKEIWQLIRVPNLFIIILTQYLTAIFLIGQNESFEKFLFDPKLLVLSFSTVCIAAAGYIINDYYDIKIDYLNRPEKVVVGKLIRRRIALATHWVLSLIGILLGVFISIEVAVINLIAAFLLWLYSNQLKRIPFVGNVSIALLTAISLLVLLLLYPQNHILVFIYAVFAFFINLIREIIKDMEDLKGDRAFGCKTLPVVWGIRKTKRFLYLIMIIFIILLTGLTLKLDNYFLKAYFVVLTIPAIYFVIKLTRSDSKKDFYYLSNFSKIIMLSGVISMIFFKLLSE